MQELQKLSAGVGGRRRGLHRRSGRGHEQRGGQERRHGQRGGSRRVAERGTRPALRDGCRVAVARGGPRLVLVLRLVLRRRRRRLVLVLLRRLRKCLLRLLLLRRLLRRRHFLRGLLLLLLLLLLLRRRRGLLLRSGLLLLLLLLANLGLRVFPVRVQKGETSSARAPNANDAARVKMAPRR